MLQFSLHNSQKFLLTFCRLMFSLTECCYYIIRGCSKMIIKYQIAQNSPLKTKKISRNSAWFCCVLGDFLCNIFSKGYFATTPYFNILYYSISKLFYHNFLQYEDNSNYCNPLYSYPPTWYKTENLRSQEYYTRDSSKTYN